MKTRNTLFAIILMVAVPYTHVTMAGERPDKLRVADAGDSIYEYGQQKSTRIERVSLPEDRQASGSNLSVNSDVSSEAAWTPTPLTESESIPEPVAASHSIPAYPVKPAASKEETKVVDAPVQQNTGPTVEERLAALTKIRVQGEISGDEYLAARKKILYGP